MFKFEKKVNPSTGETYHETTLDSKLISVNADAPTENVNKTVYYNAVIEFTNAEGQPTRSRALIYKKNWDYGMTVGETYLTTVRITPGDERGPLITVSHLTGSAKASASDFGFNLSEVKPEVKQEQPAAVADSDAF